VGDKGSNPNIKRVPLSEYQWHSSTLPSSNGRTQLSESCYRGSNPWGRAKHINIAMLQTMYNGDIAPLIEWTNDRSRVLSGVAPEPYYSWVTSLMPPDCRTRFSHHLGNMNEHSPNNGEWVKGYPHIHSKTMKWKPEVFTILTYLIAPEEGGEFAMGGLSPDDPYALIKIVPGLTVGCDSVTWHGVKPVRKGNRRVLLTVGYPENHCSNPWGRAKHINNSTDN
jgi:hypothetical protein